MSHSLTNPATWGTGDILTHAQTNDLDQKSIKSLDKTVAGDTLAGIITLTGAGRIVPTVAAAPDANATITVGAANSILRVTTSVTAPREYTFSATGAAVNDEITIICDTNFTQYVTIKDQGGAVLCRLGQLPFVDIDVASSWVKLIYIGGWIIKEIGGRRHRRAYSTAANLIASTQHVGGEEASVQGSGIYYYDATSTASSLTNEVLQPADVMGAGRWLRIDYSGRTNRIITVGASNNLGFSVPGTGANVLIANFTFNLIAGDVVILNVSGHNWSGVNALIPVWMLPGGVMSGYSTSGSYWALSNNGGRWGTQDGGSFSAGYLATASGAGNVAMYAIPPGSGGPYSCDAVWAYQQFRP